MSFVDWLALTIVVAIVMLAMYVAGVLAIWAIQEGMRQRRKAQALAHYNAWMEGEESQ